MPRPLVTRRGVRLETKWNIKWPLVNTCSAQQLRPSINQHVQVPLFSLLGAYHHLLPLINYALLLKFVFPTDRQPRIKALPCFRRSPFPWCGGGAVGGWHHHHLFTISFCSSPVVQLHFTTSVSNYYLLHICCTNNRQFLFMDM